MSVTTGFTLHTLTPVVSPHGKQRGGAFTLCSSAVNLGRNPMTCGTRTWTRAMLDARSQLLLTVKRMSSQVAAPRGTTRSRHVDKKRTLFLPRCVVMCAVAAATTAVDASFFGYRFESFNRFGWLTTDVLRCLDLCLGSSEERGAGTFD